MIGHNWSAKIEGRNNACCTAPPIVWNFRNGDELFDEIVPPLVHKEKFTCDCDEERGFNENDGFDQGGPE